MKWEHIAEFTYRLRVHEGWIVKYADTDESVGMVFVPDSENDWYIKPR